jgi:uncharacterized surface protein with fasciclin (FAS1) repeats
LISQAAFDTRGKHVSEVEVMRRWNELWIDRARRLLILGVVGGSGLALAGSGGPRSDIVETAAQNGSFNTLVAAVKAAGLADTLKGNGPFTVFAPSDEAFAKLPTGTVESLLKPENKAKLTSILTYHVVSGRVLSSDVKPGQVSTLEGSKIRVTRKDASLMVDQARIVATDFAATNGVIHVIDQVIMPEKLR